MLVPLYLLLFHLQLSHAQLLINPTKYFYTMTTSPTLSLSTQQPTVECYQCHSTSSTQDITMTSITTDQALVCNVKERDQALLLNMDDPQSVTGAAPGQWVTTNDTVIVASGGMILFD